MSHKQCLQFFLHTQFKITLFDKKCFPEGMGMSLAKSQRNYSRVHILNPFDKVQGVVFLKQAVLKVWGIFAFKEGQRYGRITFQWSTKKDLT